MRFALLGALALGAASCGLLRERDLRKPPQRPPADLVGVWAAPCEPFGFLGFRSSRSSYEFLEGGDFARVTRAYADDACREAAFTLRIHGLYDLGTKAELDEAPDALKISYTLVGVELTPDAAAAATSLADARYCGLITFAAGVATDLTGRSCAGETVERAGAVYDLVEPIGRTLHFGESLDWLEADTTEERPTSIDRTTAYVLQ